MRLFSGLLALTVLGSGSAACVVASVPLGELDHDAGTHPLPASDAGTDGSTTSGYDGSTGTGVGSEGGPGSTGDAGPQLLLQAFGGAAGLVAAQVPTVEPGVGQIETCDAPVASGACRLTSCQLGGIGDPSPGFGNYGPMTASVGSTTVDLTYTGFGYPTVDFPSSLTLGTGGIMTFHGDGNGAAIPAFDVSATIPGLGVITSPVPETDGGAANIDTSQDLAVTWVPISIGQIQFTLNGGTASVGISIACTFDGASGSGAVAQALLAKLKAGSWASGISGELASSLEASTAVDGLTIVTQSSQTSAAGARGFKVSLH